ncbi:peroxiredoxin [Picrophilus oshimae]|uniref:Alkyl hydroperoxide reductase subunit c n=1 Tax=Picrophilus torridus (strain ATCC 700027 / DSM 9790 / JCM 10055 / NBRC 100828 / KAW 2/3) TaxID=1122961 RepID=Q6KYU5_PICTO|nr:peroxiredoxin [Picrophilus oshimae]AAT44107.1 alkyl hydroperoxide reductase subunit c [Picrophilus oshimae DSM 9789]SMD30824.1 peroxiredoxin (alkyl hydroperoxide reductase subunit C) [Picrophilus oshimae DSM 9789]
MLAIGNTAPDFESPTYFPETKEIKNVRLSDYRGKWVILTFYPGDFTFVCATDIEALMGSYDKFLKENAQIFAISEDSVYSHKAWSDTSPRVSKSKIPLIDDFNKKIASAYGFLTAAGTAQRGLVIIDPEGKVQYMAMFNDGLGKDVKHIYAAFMGLKTLHDTKEPEGHMCAIPANWEPGEEVLDINVVNDIGKL